MIFFSIDKSTPDLQIARDLTAQTKPRKDYIFTSVLADKGLLLTRIRDQRGVNFIFTLIESDTTPDVIYFVNNGVKLTVGGSDVIEPLIELPNRGVDISSCGLCLEFFNVKETLAVGKISNMLELVNALEGAGNIVRL